MFTVCTWSTVWQLCIDCYVKDINVLNRVWRENTKANGRKAQRHEDKQERCTSLRWFVCVCVCEYFRDIHTECHDGMGVGLGEDVGVCVCVCVGSFTVHHCRFNRLNAGHDFCQVSEGGVGTGHHLYINIYINRFFYTHKYINTYIPMVNHKQTLISFS